MFLARCPPIAQRCVRPRRTITCRLFHRRALDDNLRVSSAGSSVLFSSRRPNVQSGGSECFLVLSSSSLKVNISLPCADDITCREVKRLPAATRSQRESANDGWLIAGVLVCSRARRARITTQLHLKTRAHRATSAI